MYFDFSEPFQGKKKKKTHVYVDAGGIEGRLEVKDRSGELVKAGADDLELVRVGAVDLHVRGLDAGVLEDGGDLAAGLGGGGSERHPAVPGVRGQQDEGSGEGVGVLFPASSVFACAC